MSRHGPRGLKWTPEIAREAWRLQQEERLSCEAIAGRVGLSESAVRRNLGTMTARRAAAEAAEAERFPAGGFPADRFLPDRIPAERIAVRRVGGSLISLPRITCIDGEG